MDMKIKGKMNDERLVHLTTTQMNSAVRNPLRIRLPVRNMHSLRSIGEPSNLRSRFLTSTPRRHTPLTTATLCDQR